LVLSLEELGLFCIIDVIISWQVRLDRRFGRGQKTEDRGQKTEGTRILDTRCS